MSLFTFRQHSRSASGVAALTFVDALEKAVYISCPKLTFCPTAILEGVAIRGQDAERKSWLGSLRTLQLQCGSAVCEIVFLLAGAREVAQALQEANHIEIEPA